MHCSFTLAALLVTAALAKPVQPQLNQKRDVIMETVYDVVYQYVYVTETEGEVAPSTTAEASTTTTTAVAATTPPANVAPAVLTHKKAPAHKSTTTSTPEPTSTAEPSTTVVKATSSVAATPSAEPTSTTEPTTTVVQATSSVAPAPSSTVATTYEDIVLLHHNVHRANHSAPDIAWSDELASIASELASRCYYQHNGSIPYSGGGYGQNIGAGAPAANVSELITNSMYNAEMPYYAPYYGAANPNLTESMFDKYGHFTQIVWQTSTLVGCATVQCSELGGVDSDVAPYMTVCNYAPPGNMGGEYGDNVGEPLGEPTVTGEYGL